MSDILKLADAMNNLAEAIRGNGAALGAALSAVATVEQTDLAEAEKPKAAAKPKDKPAAAAKPKDEPKADLSAETSAAVIALHKAKGRDVTAALMENFGVKGAKDLADDEQRLACKEMAEALLKAADEAEIAEILGGDDEFG